MAFAKTLQWSLSLVVALLLHSNNGKPIVSSQPSLVLLSPTPTVLLAALHNAQQPTATLDLVLMGVNELQYALVISFQLVLTHA
jgi:hypothetical protein